MTFCNLFVAHLRRTEHRPGNNLIDGIMKVVRDRGRILIKGCSARVCAPLTPTRARAVRTLMCVRVLSMCQRAGRERPVPTDTIINTNALFTARNHRYLIIRALNVTRARCELLRRDDIRGPAAMAP